MNKKISAIFIIAIMTLFPSASKADLDVLSIAQDQITSATEKVSAVVKQYTRIQADLQELSLNRNIVSQLKDKAKAELKSKATQFYGDAKDIAKAEGMAFLKSSLSSVSLGGIGKYVDMGGFVNPQMTVAVGQTYLKQQHKNNDLQNIVAQDERSNNLMVDNLAIMFANSLVHRKQIIDEDPCSCVDGDGQDCSEKKKQCEEQEREFNEMSDINVVKNKHFTTMLNANHRWLKIKEAVANLNKIKGENLMNQGNIDDVSAITGKIDDTKEPEASAAVVKAVMENKINLMSVVNDVKSGNYTGAVSNALGQAAGVSGDANLTNVLQNAATGVNAATNAYHNAESGNWGGALNSALSGTGNIIGNGGNENLGNIFNNAAGSAGNAVNSAINGDLGGVVSNAGNSAAGVLSSTGNGTLGAAIGAGGNLVDVGVDAANSGGNLGNILDNTLNNSQTNNALRGMENAYNSENEQNAAALKAQEEAAAKMQEDWNKFVEEQKKQLQEENKQKCQECRKNAQANNQTDAAAVLQAISQCNAVCGNLSGI